MDAERQRRTHKYLLIFFAPQIPVALLLDILFPKVFELVWQQYLIFLSIYAIVVTHWGGMNSADAGVKAEQD